MDRLRRRHVPVCFLGSFLDGGLVLLYQSRLSDDNQALCTLAQKFAWPTGRKP
jgi:hypothetical protein